MLLEDEGLASEWNVRLFSHARRSCRRKVCGTRTSDCEVFPLLNTSLIVSVRFLLTHGFHHDDGDNGETNSSHDQRCSFTTIHTPPNSSCISGREHVTSRVVTWRTSHMVFILPKL